MIILIHGPDTFRSRQKLKEIIEQHKKIRKSGVNLKYFDAQKDDFAELIEWLKSSAMFKEKKLVILKNSWQLINKIGKVSSPDNILLFYEEKEVLVDKRDNKIKIQKFDFLKGDSLKLWIKKQFDKYNIRTEKGVLDKLIYFSGDDSWGLNNEINKLASFCGNRLVRIEDVEKLVSPKTELDIFKTVRALAMKDKKKALLLIQKHLEKGQSPLYLLTMITWQFRQLILKKSYQFSAYDLKRIYRRILETDLNIKTGKIDGKTALDLLIVGL